MKTSLRKAVFSGTIAWCAACMLTLSACETFYGSSIDASRGPEVSEILKQSESLKKLKAESKAKQAKADDLSDTWNDSVSYTRALETYTEASGNPDTYLGVDFSIAYPQLSGLDPAIEETVNEVIRDRAMLLADRMYLDPREDYLAVIEGVENEDGSSYIASEVEAFVTYNDENFISVAFTDHYFVGSIYLEFSDIRAINVNLKTGEVYHFVDEIITPDEELAQDWRTRAIRKNPTSSFLEHQPSEDYLPILSNSEEYANRYFSDFFVDAKGRIRLCISYHMSVNDFIARGWIDVPFAYGELAPYRTDSTFWELPSMHVL